MSKTINNVLSAVTQDYLDQIDMNNPPTPKQIEEDILDNVKVIVGLENAVRSTGDKLRKPQYLNAPQIAMIMAKVHPICCVCTGGEDSDENNDLLALYQTEGENKGIYVTRDSVFRQLARKYNFSLTNKDFSEIMIVLRDSVPRKARCEDPNLIAVNNGIFNYTTKELTPFTPDLIFLAKSKVNYNPNAVNPVIHNDDDNTDWDVESWMNELSDDPEIVNLLWEILGAIIRPFVHWDKSAWFYSEKGNNGKGTLCELMRNLCGRGSYSSLSLSDMSKDFMLENLTRTTCIITDENDVGTFIDKAANLKSIITGDPLLVNRKFKKAITYCFHGFMVQCLNELPKFKDKSDSFYRRQLFVPFEKCFTGKERKYIKGDYLSRREVLEYVLYKVLNMNYDKLSEPKACRTVLEDYKEYNDPVRQFANEILPKAQWDLFPFNLLYEMYQSWFKNNMPSGKIQNKSTFIKEIKAIIANNNEWKHTDKQYRIAKRMSCCEPLLAEYSLIDWMNPKYAKIATASITEKCTPLPGQYSNITPRGLIRISSIK